MPVVAKESAAKETAAPAPVVVRPPGLLTPVVAACEPMPQPMVLPPPLPAFTGTMPVPSAQPHHLALVPPPLSYNSARFCPMPAYLQPHEGQFCSPVPANLQPHEGQFCSPVPA